jgi:hypothetical protein
MYEVTVSRMRERYAQAVPIFRLTYVNVKRYSTWRPFSVTAGCISFASYHPDSCGGGGSYTHYIQMRDV